MFFTNLNCGKETLFEERLILEEISKLLSLYLFPSPDANKHICGDIHELCICNFAVNYINCFKL